MSSLEYSKSDIPKKTKISNNLTQREWLIIALSFTEYAIAEVDLSTHGRFSFFFWKFSRYKARRFLISKVDTPHNYLFTLLGKKIHKAVLNLFTLL